MFPASPELRGKAIDDHESDVVARTLVFRAGVAQSGNQSNACWLRLQDRSGRKQQREASLLLLFILRRGSFGRSCGGGGGSFSPFRLLLADDFRPSGRRFGHCGNRLFFHRRSKN